MLMLQDCTHLLTWKYPRQASVFHPCKKAPTQYIKWENTLFYCIKKWQHAGNTFPLSISFVPFAFKLHHKLCATLRSFCHWPLLMCKFTSLPDCDFVDALTVYINKLRRNGCTSLHSFTCADNNWMTNTAKSKHWQECDGKHKVCEELITTMTTTENMESGRQALQENCFVVVVVSYICSISPLLTNSITGPRPTSDWSYQKKYVQITN